MALLKRTKDQEPRLYWIRQPGRIDCLPAQGVLDDKNAHLCQAWGLLRVEEPKAISPSLADTMYSMQVCLGVSKSCLVIHSLYVSKGS